MCSEGNTDYFLHQHNEKIRKIHNGKTKQPGVKRHIWPSAKHSTASPSLLHRLQAINDQTAYSQFKLPPSWRHFFFPFPECLARSLSGGGCPLRCRIQCVGGWSWELPEERTMSLRAVPSRSDNNEAFSEDTLGVKLASCLLWWIHLCDSVEHWCKKGWSVGHCSKTSL